MKLLTIRTLVLTAAISGPLAALACSSGSSGNGSTSDGGGSSSGKSSSSGTTSSSGSGSDSGGSDGGAAPSISISSPMMGATVMSKAGMDPTTKVIDVSFTTMNFTLKPPGTCGSAATDCGHVHLYVDDTACTPDGAPYNNASPSSAAMMASPMEAILSDCPMVAGAHTVKLELHNDDHSLFKFNGAAVTASVMFTAQ